MMVPVDWSADRAHEELAVRIARMAPGDPVNHPTHYNQVPGVECIDVVEHFGFLRGNAIKYLWRAGAKGDTLEDLRKARWYLDREIGNLEAERDASEQANQLEYGRLDE